MSQKKKILPSETPTPMRPEKNSARLPSKIVSGNVERRTIKCGKASCRCKSGEQHGPYTYVRIYRGGRRWRVYIKGSDVAKLEAARLLEKQRRKEVQESKRTAREFNQELRQNLALLRSLMQGR